MEPTRTPDGKVVLYAIQGRARFERYPVDARDMLATGAYTTDHASATENAVSVDAGSGLPVAIEAASAPHVDTFVDDVEHTPPTNDAPDEDALRHDTEAPAGVDVPDPVVSKGKHKGRRS